MFVRVGPELHDVERFRRAELPEAWRSRQGMLFYANVIAYHPAADRLLPDPRPRRLPRAYRAAEAAPDRTAA
jgi:hypothetical protein